MLKHNRFFSSLAIALLLFFALSSFVFSGLQHTALWIAVPGAAVCSFLAMPRKRMDNYLILQIVLYLWIAFTALFAFDIHLAGLQLKRIAGCFLMIYSVSKLARSQKLVIWLYLVYLVFYIGIVYYARTSILTGGFDYTSERLDDDILNANVVAYFTFFTTFIVFIISEFSKKQWLVRLFRVLFLLSPVWSFFVALLTASRQVIVIQIPLIILLLYIRYIRQRKPSTKIIFLALSIMIGAYLAIIGEKYYEGSNLSQRNELSIDEDARMVLFKTAIITGLQHPIVGVGPGCYGIYSRGTYTFSHNNYTELFANCGFPALLLCIVLYWKFIKTQWRRYKKTKDKMFLVFLTFGVMYTIDNMFYVFYTAPWLMSFFFLVASHSENYYQIKHNLTSSGIITQNIINK